MDYLTMAAGIPTGCRHVINDLKGLFNSSSKFPTNFQPTGLIYNAKKELANYTQGSHPEEVRQRIF